MRRLTIEDLHKVGKRTDGTHSKGNPIICFRDSDELKDKIAKACKKTGETASDFIRRILDREASRAITKD